MLGILGLWQQTGSHGNFIQYNPIFLSLPSSPLGSYYLMADFRLTPKEEVMQRSLSTSRFKQIEFVFPLWSQGRQEPISYFICAFLLLFSQNWNLVYIWKVHFLLRKNRGSSFGRKFWGSSLVHHWGLWHLLLTPTRFLVEPIEIMHASEKSR